jgi:hypothetical protein
MVQILNFKKGGNNYKMKSHSNTFKCLGKSNVLLWNS